MMQKLGIFFAGLLGDGDNPSFGRFASLLSLVFCLGWDTGYIVFVMMHFQAFHFAPGDLLAYGGILLAQGAFCSLFYGFNKVTGMGVFNRDQGRRDGQPNQ